MGSTIPNLDEVMKAALKDIDALEKRMTYNIQQVLLDTDRHLKALTPVNTGQAVRNYIWTVGVPNQIVYEAIDNGPPGPTNSMALGVEPRRGVNESAAFESLLALDVANPFQHFICSNNSPDIEGLELGTLPGPPLSSRSPSGMFGQVAAYISVMLASKGIMS